MQSPGSRLPFDPMHCGGFQYRSREKFRCRKSEVCCTAVRYPLPPMHPPQSLPLRRSALPMPGLSPRFPRRWCPKPREPLPKPDGIPQRFPAPPPPYAGSPEYDRRSRVRWRPASPPGCPVQPPVPAGGCSISAYPSDNRKCTAQHFQSCPFPGAAPVPAPR